MTTRWFVEVSPVDADTLKERYCVEALQWQQALQQARKLRGDRGPLSRFAIELLDVGYRATDPSVQIRYTVSRAPGDAPLSGGAPANGSAKSPAQPAAPAAASPAPVAPAPPAPVAPAKAPVVAPAAAAPAPAPVVAPVVAPPPAPVVAPAVVAPPPAAVAVPAAAAAVIAPEAKAAPPVVQTSKTARSVPPIAGPTPPVPLVVPKDPAQRAGSAHSTSPAVPRPMRAAAEELRAAPAAAAPQVPERQPEAPSAMPAPATPAEEPVPSLPGLTLISRRSEEPTEASPIIYREFAFAVEPGLAPKDLERYARATWEQVRTSLASRTGGKFVQIALFDHQFQGRPQRPPLAVLAWKDWRGDPAIQIRGAAPKGAAEAPQPAAAAPAAPAPVAAAPLAAFPAPAVPSAAFPAPGAAVAAAPVAAAPVATAPIPVATAPIPVATAPIPVAAAPIEPAAAAAIAPVPAQTAAAAPVAAPDPVISATPSRRPLAPVQTATGRRSPSEDLISELFEEMHQLHFMPDIVTGAEYVLTILGRVLPSEGILIHVFDINARQFVVVRAAGPKSTAVLLHRTPDTFAIFRETFRRARALTFPDVSKLDGFHNGRWELLGVTPQLALCGAVQQGGRYLGVIELANPAGGEAFHDGEVNAVDYICEQFADFVASRPIVIDDDAVIPRA